MAVAASSPLYSLLLMLSFRQDISNGLKQRTFLMGYYTCWLTPLTENRVHSNLQRRSARCGAFAQRLHIELWGQGCGYCSRPTEHLIPLYISATYIEEEAPKCSQWKWIKPIPNSDTSIDSGCCSE